MRGSEASISALAARHGINPKTVAKWRRRETAVGAVMGPRDPLSTVLSREEEGLVVAFRKHTLLPLGDGCRGIHADLGYLPRSILVM